MARSAQPERTLKEAADIYIDLQMDEAGERLYLEGTRRYPAYAPNFLALGARRLQSKRPAEALPYFRKALDCPLDPRTREQVRGLVTDLEAAGGAAGAK